MAKRKHINEARLGAFIILMLAVFAYLSLKVGRFSVGEDIKVDAVFDDASGLVKDAAVMVAGVRVGTVSGLSVEHDKARVTMMLHPDAKVRKDARATIRMKSLLGEKFLEIIPGARDAPLIESGDTIKYTFIQTEFDQLVNRLDAVVKRLERNDPKTGNLFDNLAKLTASLSEIAAESKESIPPALRNLRDVTKDLKEILAENKQGMKDTLAEVRGLAGNASKVLKRNEGHIDSIVKNLDKSTAVVAQHSDEIATNLNHVLKNLSEATDKLPKTMDNLSRLSLKFEKTLDETNRLLVKLDALDGRTIRKFFQEDGITINLFRKKIEDDKESSEDKQKEEPEERGWLIFPK
ncbi:MAG: MCE family protein [Planctomycetes bacterium]|nr:MCE family protein [Planctomycetota bacterium]